MCEGVCSLSAVCAARRTCLSTSDEALFEVITLYGSLAPRGARGSQLRSGGVAAATASFSESGLCVKGTRPVSYRRGKRGVISNSICSSFLVLFFPPNSAGLNFLDALTLSFHFDLTRHTHC